LPSGCFVGFNNCGCQA